MKTDKELKKWFKEVASKEPDKYYATDILVRLKPVVFITISVTQPFIQTINDSVFWRAVIKPIAPGRDG